MKKRDIIIAGIIGVIISFYIGFAIGDKYANNLNIEKEKTAQQLINEKINNIE